MYNYTITKLHKLNANICPSMPIYLLVYGMLFNGMRFMCTPHLYACAYAKHCPYAVLSLCVFRRRLVTFSCCCYSFKVLTFCLLSWSNTDSQLTPTMLWFWYCGHDLFFAGFFYVHIHDRMDGLTNETNDSFFFFFSNSWFGLDKQHLFNLILFLVCIRHGI